jgi:hypothetical protein
MDRMDAIAWVLSSCSELRLSQSKTLSELVAASLGVGRVSLPGWAITARMKVPTLARRHLISSMPLPRGTLALRARINVRFGNHGSGRDDTVLLAGLERGDDGAFFLFEVSLAILTRPLNLSRWHRILTTAMAVMEGPMPVMWWQRRLWLRAALLLNSLSRFAAHRCQLRSIKGFWMSGRLRRRGR